MPKHRGNVMKLMVYQCIQCGHRQAAPEGTMYPCGRCKAPFAAMVLQERKAG